MTPEGRVKKMVKKALDTLGEDCWRFMPVQTGFGSPALDYLLAIRGRFVAIETKAPGKRLTALQEGTKAAIEAAGGIVLVVWDEGSLAIAMKIILALEFAPHVSHLPEGLSAGLDAALGYPRQDYCAFKHGSEEERSHERYLCGEQPAQAADGAAGGDHGASGGQPQRPAVKKPRRKNQRLTAAVTYRCAACGSEIEHPSMLRSIPWCCDIPMERS